MGRLLLAEAQVPIRRMMQSGADSRQCLSVCFVTRANYTGKRRQGRNVANVAGDRHLLLEVTDGNSNFSKTEGSAWSSS